tara:strand:- start:1615 stop:2085 length:471 start_codon:yes stop_codon:yes gene_type:complete
MWKIIFVLISILLIKAYPTQKPIFSGPYHALKCGSNRNASVQEVFIYDNKKGYLYYFDRAQEKFKPLSQRVDKGIYLNSMEEITSRLKSNKLIGNKLVITYIDYLNQKDSQKTIIEKSINLRWLVMNTFYQKNSEDILIRKDNCVWVDPKKVSASY